MKPKFYIYTKNPLLNEEEKILLKIFFSFIGFGLIISGIYGLYLLAQNNGAGPKDSWFYFGQILMGFVFFISLSISKNVKLQKIKEKIQL